MKKGTEKTRRNIEKNIFYKTNPSGGISLIVLVITIIVVIILAAAVIISLQNNNPMIEANKARINSDVANMQAIFTNTVGKIMAENQDVVEIEAVQLNSVTTGKSKTTGETTYKIVGTDGTAVVQGKIKFSTEKSEGTIYCTGKELPLYSSETIWYVDKQGLLSVEVGGVSYGEGEQLEEEGEEIAKSDNPMLQQWTSTSTTDFHAEEYKTKITKVKFAVNVKVPNSKIESWDVSQAKDGSVMAWVQSDGNEGYILTIAGKEKIIANTNSSLLFYSFIKVKEIENLQILDTSNVTNMTSMFNSCRNLTSLDLSRFDTSNVTGMSNMFYNCRSLTSINFGDNFNTSSVTSMGAMFSNCSSLESLDVSNFDTSNVTDMAGMFSNCSSLTNIDVSSFDTSNVTSMNDMFNGGSKLTSINFGSNFSTSNVTIIQNIFRNCNSLTSLDLSSFDTGNLTVLYGMFEGCTNLNNLNISHFNVDNCKDMRNLFKDCTSLSNLNLFTINYKGGTGNGIATSEMFYNCNKLSATISIIFSGTNIALGYCNNMFYNAATEPGAKITIRYNQNEEIVNGYLNTKSSNSNIVKELM